MCQNGWSLLRTPRESLFHDSLLACGGGGGVLRKSLAFPGL